MIIIVCVNNYKLNIKPFDTQLDQAMIQYCNLFEQFRITFNFHGYIEIEPTWWRSEFDNVEEFILEELEDHWALCIRWKNDRIHMYTNPDDEVALTN